MTVQNLIEDALVLTGELGRGQTASPEDLANGLFVLNALRDVWSTERLMLPSVTKLDCQLVPGQQDYTIGPSGADFTNERPVLIQTATIVFPSS